MAECDACGKDSDKLLYTCSHCDKKVCSDCRLPENHFCGLRERVDEIPQWNRGTASSTTEGPIKGEDARAECKTDDCSNTSDYDSPFCPKCLNKDAREEAERQLFGKTECRSKTCSNVAGHDNRFCLDCRREKASSSGSPDVDTVDGSPYNNTGSASAAEGTAAHSGDRSIIERVRLGLKRVRIRSKNGFWWAFGIILWPLFFAWELLAILFGFLTSKAGFTFLAIGLIALAAGPLGIVAVPGGVDDFAGGVQGWFEETAAEATDEETLNESRVQELVHQEVNERRSQKDLSRLEYSTDLQQVARFHASNMYSQGFFSHTSPSGAEPQDRYSRFGISCSAGENIAKTHAKVTVITDDGSKYYETNEGLARGIVNQWMNSTGHRENILRSSFDSEGIGIRIVEDGDDEGLAVYAVQNFCA